jgi:formate/nitrite transporter FocA (FNT family)
VSQKPQNESEAESSEAEEAEERRAPSGKVVYDAIVLEGREELDRSSAALFWSGLAAGLSMGFSLVVEGILQAALPDTPWRPLVSKLGYATGFLLVILGRQQLFTENTLTPILPLLKHREPGMASNVLRLWSVVLIGNLLGAAAFALVAAHTGVFEPETKNAFTQMGLRAIEPGFSLILLRGIFAGWLIALLIWLLPFAETSRVVVIIIVAWLIGVAHLSHVVAGSVDVFFLAAVRGDSWLHAVGGFVAPSLIGNVIGGCTLVAALAHAQVVSGEEGEPPGDGRHGR